MSYGQAAAGGSPTKKKRHKDDFYSTKDPDATEVVSTDKIARGYGTVQDFLSTSRPLAPAIVTNPPFNLAAEFIQHALFVLGVEYLALYLKATFYHAAERVSLYEAFKPSLICPLTFRVDFSGEGRPTMETSWYLWAPHLEPRGLYQPIGRLHPKPRRGRK